jgi:hypothetical protein
MEYNTNETTHVDQKEEYLKEDHVENAVNEDPVAVEDTTFEFEGENPYFQKVSGIKEERKVNDSPVNSSTDGSTRRFFLDSLNVNAKVLRSQIGELQTDATRYVDQWILGLQYFQDMKATINNRINEFFRPLFNLTGYNYHLDTGKVNFFIFATQAWLMEITRVVQYKMRGGKITYSKLLNVLKESNVKEDNFITNLKILTNSSFDENFFVSIMIENNVGKMYLNSLKVQLSSLDDIENLDNKKFEMILTDIFRKTVECVLNSLENQFSDSGVNIPYLDLYDDSLSFEEYFMKIQATQRDSNPMNLYSLKISCESFYNFAKCRLDDMISDISYFSQNYSSIVFKSKTFMNKNLNREKVGLLLKDLVNLVQTTTFNFNNFGKEKFNNCYTLAHNIKDIVVQRQIITNMTKYANYIEPVVKPVRDYTASLINLFNDRAGVIIKHQMSLVFNTTAFITKQWEISKQDYDELKQKLSEYIKTRYNDVFVKVKPIFYVEKDGELQFRFTLDRKFIFINPIILADIYHFINNYITAVRDVILFRLEYTKENFVLGAMDYLLKKYQLFLGSKEKNN